VAVDFANLALAIMHATPSIVLMRRVSIGAVSADPLSRTRLARESARKAEADSGNKQVHDNLQAHPNGSCKFGYIPRAHAGSGVAWKATKS
jgi:hypothetical protein